MESLPEEEFKQSVTELIHRFTGESQICGVISLDSHAIGGLLDLLITTMSLHW